MDITHFRGGAYLETWLKSIAQHVILDVVQAAARDQGRLSTATAVPDPENSKVRKNRPGPLLRELTEVLGMSKGIGP